MPQGHILLSKLFPVSLFGLFGLAAAYAGELDIGLSNEVAQVSYGQRYNEQARLQASYLHSDTDQHKSTVLGVGVLTGQDNGDLQPRLGAKVFLVDGEGPSNSGYGLALTAGADFSLMPKWILSADAAYAPKIIMGGDFDGYYEFSARCGYQLIKNGAVYLGYQKHQASSPSYGVYEGVVLGVKFAL